MDNINKVTQMLKNMDEDIQSYLIYGLIIFILIFYLIYIIHISKLRKKECSAMEKLYPSVDGYLKSIDPNNEDFKFNLCDYYIKTAFNACSGGSYKNDVVDICNLKAILRQGVRCVDFEVYSINNEPCIATSTTEDYNIKETFNSVKFSLVMDTINNYAFASGTCPNHNDPLIIHLRCKSANTKMYEKLAEIFKTYNNIMLGPSYSYEKNGKNLGSIKLNQLMNKVILIIDRSNTAFLNSDTLTEYVNMTSNSVFMRGLRYYDVKNTPDMNELIDFNRRCMTIVFPDKGINPINPNPVVSRANGCQMVAMRFNYVDNYLMENTAFFDREASAFVLKPEALRGKVVTIPPPQPQNENYSYQTRNITTDLYSFKY